MSHSKLFDHAMNAAKEAVSLDRQGDYEEAFKKYMHAAETLLEFLKYNKNEKLEHIVEARMEEYIDRARYLKKKISGKTAKAYPSVNKGGSGGSGRDKIAETEDEDDVDEETKRLREMISDTIITEKPNVSWDDVAGLSRVKQALREAIVLPIIQPKIFRGARKPWTGILLFGPPGCGKTLMAKAAANECTATFYSADSASLVSKWLGESEKLIKTLFELARKTSPSLIFIDEVDSLTTTRGGSGSEGGGERRLKTQLMQEMQGMKSSNKKRILVLGATNRPWDLDPAFLRRFEKKIYIPLPDIKSREAILKIHTKGIEIDEDVDFKELARLTIGYSGSDLSLVCREAIMIPVRELDLNGVIDDGEVDIRPVRRDDFIGALEIQKPVSTPRDLKQFKEWSDEFGV
ncbi:AAA family ATPase [Candidatus Bathyarchaeota archaeon]|nr:AAA family ATPase [Candidatus Bathyarchaeota archaeon]